MQPSYVDFKTSYAQHYVPAPKTTPTYVCQQVSASQNPTPGHYPAQSTPVGSGICQLLRKHLAHCHMLQCYLQSATDRVHQGLHKGRVHSVACACMRIPYNSDLLVPRNRIRELCLSNLYAILMLDSNIIVCFGACSMGGKVLHTVVFFNGTVQSFSDNFLHIMHCLQRCIA